MANAKESTATPFTLPKDVYEADLEFRATVRMATDNLDSDSSNAMYKSAGLIVVEAIGRDPVKLFALIDVVHDRVLKQRMWVVTVGVKFYK
jgi:hypothetical protein